MHANHATASIASMAFHDPTALHRALRLPAASPLLVGLSGGLDSTVLLHALSCDAEIRTKGLRAVHVHHGLQSSATDWGNHCRALCESLDIDLQVVEVHVDRNSGEGLEAAARKAQWGRIPEGHFQGIATMSGYDTYLAQVMEVSMEGDKLKIHRVVCAIDCGQMVNPDIVRAQAEGSIIFGLTAALYDDINIANGQVREQNFNDYRMMRMNETPKIEVHLIESGEAPGGIGETGTTAAPPALANAIFAATGVRLRTLPIDTTLLAKGSA